MATDITYNGTVIKSLEAGKTATLACAGKKAVGNIVVAFDNDGNITYNGSTTEVGSGKTATMQCAGKKMTSDVYITIPTTGAMGTWVFNDELVLNNFETSGTDNTSKYYWFDIDFTFNNCAKSYKSMRVATLQYKDLYFVSQLMYKVEEKTVSSTNYNLPYQAVIVKYEQGVTYQWNKVNYNNTTYPITDVRTITITGGADVNNAELLEWLEANATKQ